MLEKIGPYIQAYKAVEKQVSQWLSTGNFEKAEAFSALIDRHRKHTLKHVGEVKKRVAKAAIEGGNFPIDEDEIELIRRATRLSGVRLLACETAIRKFFEEETPREVNPIAYEYAVTGAQIIDGNAPETWKDLQSAISAVHFVTPDAVAKALVNAGFHVPVGKGRGKEAYRQNLVETFGRIQDFAVNGNT